MDFLRDAQFKIGQGAAAFPVVSRRCWAQTYPARPVRILVGYSPGGVSDVLSRLIAQRLSERLANNSSSRTDLAPRAMSRLRWP
jgi:tripartite-type tricarboxylate transporter receptor subunit TctC